MAERGTIRNLKFARQRADFNGMRFENITPTDIDGAIEFGDEVFIFMETKTGAAPLPTGQRLFLERVCDRIQNSGAHALVLVLSKQPSVNADTYEMKSLQVVQYRHGEKWSVPPEPMTALQAIERFATRKLGRKVEASSQSVPKETVHDDWLRDYEAGEQSARFKG